LLNPEAILTISHVFGHSSGCIYLTLKLCLTFKQINDYIDQNVMSTSQLSFVTKNRKYGYIHMHIETGA